MSTNTHTSSKHSNGDKWARALRLGTGANVKKTANMAHAIGRGLICGWGKPTKPLLHNTN